MSRESALLAQTVSPGPAKLRAGALQVEPAFAVHTGPSSNINKDEEALAIQAFETALIPHFDVNWRSGRNEVQGFVAFEFVLFGNPRTIAGAPAYTAGGHNTFTEAVWSRSARLTPRFEYRHRNNGARANDIEEVALKSRRVEDTLSSSFDLRAGARAHVGGELALQRTRYDADAVYEGNLLSDFLDFDRTIVSSAFGYELTPLTNVGTNVVSIRDRFVRNPSRDTDSITWNGIVTFAPRALFTGVASVGFKSFPAPDPGAEDFSGIVMRTALNYAIRDSTLVMLSLDRNTEYSYDTQKSYYVANLAVLSVEQRVVGRLEVFAQGSLYTLSYRGIEQNRERQIAYGGGLRIRLRPWARVGFNVDQITRNGELPWNATRLVAFLTYGTRFRKLERTMPGEDYTK